HPDVGLLVIEAKGHVIDDIEGLEAGHIMVRYQGYTKPKSVIQQVEDQMFEIDHDMMRLVRNRREKPLSNCMAAFANISESEWRGKGYDEAYPSSQLLFRDHLMDQSRLKKRINNLVGETLKESNKEQPLTAEQIN